MKWEKQLHLQKFKGQLLISLLRVSVTKRIPRQMHKELHTYFKSLWSDGSF